MADELFFIGGYGVKPSDIIAIGALALSAVSALAATRSSRAASRSSATAAANLRREQDKEAKAGEIRVSTIVHNDDDEGPGPQRHLSLAFRQPLNGDYCEIRECEIIHPKGCVLELRYYGIVVTSRHNGERPNIFKLAPAITIDNADVPVNATFHLVSFDNKPTHIRFHGERMDASRSKISADVLTPAIDRNR